jgi:hypothetical protein
MEHHAERGRKGMTKREPEIKFTAEGWKVVRISSVGDKFREWLYGQTLPLLEGDDNPFDWAYYADYERFIKGLPIID